MACELQLDVLNLFNAQTNQIEYYYLSRLPGESLSASPTATCIRLSRSLSEYRWPGRSDRGARLAERRSQKKLGLCRTG